MNNEGQPENYSDPEIHQYMGEKSYYQQSQPPQSPPQPPPQPYVQPYVQPYRQQEHIIIIEPQEPYAPQQQDRLGIAPILYCACLALIFLPFGWFFGLIALCWYNTLTRQPTQSEKTAAKILTICLWVNALITLFYIMVMWSN
jgi:hypothetical protein